MAICCYRIGLAIAERLAQDGAKVMLSSRKQKNVDNAVSTLREKGLVVSGVVCHVGNRAHRENLIKKTLEEYGGIDILVNNAAVNPVFGPILDTTEIAWDKIFEINVKSAFFLTKEVVPHIESRGGGAVVFVSSQGGYSPSELMGAYSVSKTTLLGLVKALVPQLISMNIRVYGIAPGVIETRFSEALWKSPVSEIAKSTIPMKRFGKPEECAGAVSFLVSEDASYITGETVTMNGGMPSRL